MKYFCFLLTKYYGSAYYLPIALPHLCFVSWSTCIDAKIRRSFQWGMMFINKETEINLVGTIPFQYFCVMFWVITRNVPELARWTELWGSIVSFKSNWWYINGVVLTVSRYLGPGYIWLESWVDIVWWRHQMERFSALLAICARNSVNSQLNSLICAWINGKVNNRQAGYLRHHRAHYDVIVIE